MRAAFLHLAGFRQRHIPPHCRRGLGGVILAGCMVEAAMNDDDSQKPDSTAGVTRRDFMKISGIGVAVPLVLGPKIVEAAWEEVAVHGPGKVPITLNVNGGKLTAQLEPRVTLLDALREKFNLYGP